MSMGLAEYIALFLIGLFVFANLLHPGGWGLTILLVLLVVSAYAASRFLPEYILTTNQGKNAARQRKRKRRDRRARGLDPRTWFGRDRGGRRRGGQQRQQPQNQQPRDRGGDRRE